VIRAFQRAQAGERGRRARLATAQAAIAVRHERRRGQRRGSDPSALQVAVDTSLARDRVHGLLHVW
jgi:hypothetical protein